ncbi:DnaJ C-terminal domain-containing protein [Virgisporangium ochraceum]|uniref:Molecular chaperone DnaJ n=1 Tax=Virgisporangium ochraceum TaxID=65505 RepID=A0A8J4A2G2_9ACTN|nr:DnaJ C-terminal domain-containing protein [Virgisporangium ochraceum]GIJ72938.1 molecular chaperone DnaJ [Virgisporangium ochraceum]
MATTTSDYYRVLGVDRSADREELQRAYRKLARRFHPDVSDEPDAEDRFKEITEAYEVLSDPAKRARYDRFGEAWRRVPDDHDGPAPGAGDGPDLSGVNLEDLLGDLFGGSGSGGSGFGGGFGGGGFGPGGFSPGGFGAPTSAPGVDVEAEIEIPVDDAYAGGRRRITLQTPTGPRTITVTVPAGVVQGQRIRLAGHGVPGFGGGPPGDLYLRVRLAPHPRYRVDGRDLAIDLRVAPWEAALGATVPLDTPGGRVEVKVPAGSSSGLRLRLRGRGMPNPRGSAGDLFADVKVVVPDRPTDAERDLWRQLAEVSTLDPRGQ